MTSVSPILQKAFALLRSGNDADALRIVQTAAAESPNDPALCAFLGMMLCQRGDLAEGVVYLRRALLAWPHDMATRANLARALTAIGDIEEAERLCLEAPAQDGRIDKILGFVHQSRGDLQQAARCYEAVVRQFPNDHESWNNLGNVRSEMDDGEGSIAAFARASSLCPQSPEIQLNYARCLARYDRKEERQRVMRAAVRAMPEKAELWAELGMSETAAHDFKAGEQAYREALRLRPGMILAYIELGLLLENLNRLDALDALLATLEAEGVSDPELMFLKAWSLRRRGRNVEALAFAERVPPTIEAMRRHQLIAELADRLGDEKRAYASFEEMNRASAAQPHVRPENSDYREQIEQETERLTPQWIESWSQIDVAPSPPAPVFIVGFPRSGTTLLDTMLMNIQNLHVLEELPVMRQSELQLGGFERLATLSDEQANVLRSTYFHVLQNISPPPNDNSLIIDKYPLHMARIPLIQRIFPDAKIVLVERHPCDVVLSCFMANFTLNRAMRHFTTLDSAARLYDTVFTAWSRATELLPISYHRVRYERLVDDAETEMRHLLAYLQIDWNPAVLDNQAAASRRHHIGTASYSQVTEPIYRRASGRWQRYREPMARVIPLIEPWAHHMGYDM